MHAIFQRARSRPSLSSFSITKLVCAHRHNLVSSATKTTSNMSGKPTVTEKPLLLTYWACPYVQRIWIALNYKQIEYDSADVDLFNKPSWFLEVSPFGKVPVITYKEDANTEVLYESLVLLDWAEDFKPTPSLMPQGATARAKARIAIARYDKVTTAFYKMLRSAGKEEAHAVAADMRAELSWMESNLSPEGPYFMGSELGMVDCALAPWIIRDFLLKHYRGFDMLSGYPKLQAYRDALRAHPAIISTMKAPEGQDWNGGMIKTYIAYGGEPVKYFE